MSDHIFEEFHGDGKYGSIHCAFCGEEVICKTLDGEARGLPWAAEHWDALVISFTEKHRFCKEQE